MKKKISGILLTVCMLMCLAVVSVSADTIDDGILYYQVENGEATVTGMVDTNIGGEIIIPSTIEGYPVTCISSYPFWGCEDVSITIPGSITSIQNGCFATSSISAFTVDSTNQYYSSQDGVLFNKDKTELISYPYKRKGEYTIPSSVTSIGYGAFMGVDINSIIIPENVKNIGTHAFDCCRNLTNLTICDGVTSIGEYAFSECGFSSVTIPSSVKNIGEGAFLMNGNLTNLTICDGVTSIGEYAFSECGFSSVTVPNSVMSIGYGAFAPNGNLSEITLPFIGSDRNATYSGSIDYIFGIDSAYGTQCDVEKVTITDATQIYDYALSGRPESLKSVILNEGITSIGNYAFAEDYSLSSINIPSTVTSIGEGAFLRCTEINIDFPNSAMIGNGAFQECGFTNVIIPKGVISIGIGVFDNCEKLKSITIPNTVTSFPAMMWCYNLTDVYYGGTKEEWENLADDMYEGDEWGLHNSLHDATIHYNCLFANGALTEPIDYKGEMIDIPEGNHLDITENLYFRNGYINTEGGYVKSGEKKITGKHIYFNNDGLIVMGDGENAKIEVEHTDGSTDQGFVIGKANIHGVLKVILELSGTANGTNYTGRTITKKYDFRNIESVQGKTINIGLTVANVLKGLSLNVKEISIEN